MFWHGICGERLTQIINDVYRQIVHRRPNLFKLPSGTLGKRFIAELAQLFRDFAFGSALEHLSIKVAMIMPALLLQKHSATSKTNPVYNAGLCCGKQLTSMNYSLREGKSKNIFPQCLVQECLHRRIKQD